jgi:RNA-directed DNA polymerase
MCLFAVVLSSILSYAGYRAFGVAGALIGFSAAPFIYERLNALQRRHAYSIRANPLRWLCAKLGWGKGLAELARRIDMAEYDLRAFNPSYSEVFIPKRNDQRRRLLVPDDKTKIVQRRILHRLLKKLRVHPAAQGFVRGRSAGTNAAQHSGQAVVITLDIIDFFSSTKATRVEEYFRRIGWNAECARILTRLTTHDGGLPQGAPTSPALSNLVNYYLDVQIAGRVALHQGTYTRYADDIAISYPLDYPFSIHWIVDRVKKILKPKGYRIHTLKKLRIRRRHQRQVVTGLVVNAKPQLPRETRRWLRAIKHRQTKDESITLAPAQLQGWLAYEASIKKLPAPPPRDHTIEENQKVVRKRKRRYEKFKARTPGIVR